jgi:hypothetical protein
VQADKAIQGAGDARPTTWSQFIVAAARRTRGSQRKCVLVEVLPYFPCFKSRKAGLSSHMPNRIVTIATRKMSGGKGRKKSKRSICNQLRCFTGLISRDARRSRQERACITCVHFAPPKFMFLPESRLGNTCACFQIQAMHWDTSTLVVSCFILSVLDITIQNCVFTSSSTNISK